MGEDVPTTTKTAGLNPKVPTQAVVTLVVFVAAYFGIDLDAELALALSTILGFVAGVAAPPSPTVAVTVHD